VARAVAAAYERTGAKPAAVHVSSVDDRGARVE
jgi:hypothetical protein